MLFFVLKEKMVFGGALHLNMLMARFLILSN